MIDNNSNQKTIENIPSEVIKELQSILGEQYGVTINNDSDTSLTLTLRGDATQFPDNIYEHLELIPPHLCTETYKFLIDNGVNKQILFKYIFKIHNAKIQEETLQYLLQNKGGDELSLTDLYFGCVPSVNTLDMLIGHWKNNDDMKNKIYEAAIASHHHFGETATQNSSYTQMLKGVRAEVDLTQFYIPILQYSDALIEEITDNNIISPVKLFSITWHSSAYQYIEGKKVLDQSMTDKQNNLIKKCIEQYNVAELPQVLHIPQSINIDNLKLLIERFPTQILKLVLHPYNNALEQDQVIDLLKKAMENDVSFNGIDIPKTTPVEYYDILFSKENQNNEKRNPSIIVDNALELLNDNNAENWPKGFELIDKARSLGTNVNPQSVLPYLMPIANIVKLVNDYDYPAESLAKWLDYITTNDYNGAMLQAHQDNLGLLRAYKKEIDDCFIDKLHDINLKSILPSRQWIERLFEHKLIDNTCLIGYSIQFNDTQWLDEAIEKHPGSLTEILISQYNIMSLALEYGSVECIRHIAEQFFQHKLNNATTQDIISSYIGYIISHSFTEACEIITIFTSYFDQNDLTNTLNSASALERDAIFKILDLAKKYNQQDMLTELERNILNLKREISIQDIEGTIDTTDDVQIDKIIDYTIIARRYDLIQPLIKKISKSNMQENKLVYIIHLLFLRNPIDNSQSIGDLTEQYYVLLEFILAKIQNIDSINNQGESVTTTLLAVQNITEPLTKLILKKSLDPIFALDKTLNEDNDLSSKYPPEKLPELFDTNKTYIGIAHGHGFWSSNVWCVGELIMAQHKNIIFHRISEEIIEYFGDDILSYFHGFINPGSSDRYPRTKKTVTLEEYQKADNMYDIEKMFHVILDSVHAKHPPIPTLGICGGMQHMALKMQASIEPVAGYSYGKHEVTFKIGTLSYFMCLTPEQQQAIIDHKISASALPLPEIKFKGDTAHCFAVISNSSDQIHTDATSEDVVTMAISTHLKHGINFGTQFHPEHYYYTKSDESQTIPDDHIIQQRWIDNWVNIVVKYHDNPNDPMEYLKKGMDAMHELLGHTEEVISGE